MGRTSSASGLNRVRFFGGQVILPDRVLDRAEVLCDHGKIVAITKPRRNARTNSKIHSVDLQGGFLSPGFVDLHVHGGGGADFMDGSADAVQAALETHLLHGTTTLFPTTSTGTPTELARMIRAVAECKSKKRSVQGSRIAGVHLYGPYFAPEKSGCHSSSACRPPQSHEFESYFHTGLIKIATCAAELEGAADFYRSARRRKCLITCGHSNASWSEMQMAFDLGMRHVDHFWCAMSNVASVRQRLGVPMQGSMLEFVLGNAEMSTEVIADGCHLAPELLEFAFRMKGADRLCLVTDASRALDMPKGKYRFGPIESGTEFTSDGRVGWASNGGLASSVQGMDHMVRTMKEQTTATLPEVIRMASLTPARRAGISRKVGSIEVGKRADLLLLDSQLHLQDVWLGGISYRSAKKPM